MADQHQCAVTIVPRLVFARAFVCIISSHVAFPLLRSPEGHVDSHDPVGMAPEGKGSVIKMCLWVVGLDSG